MLILCRLSCCFHCSYHLQPVLLYRRVHTLHLQPFEGYTFIFEYGIFDNPQETVETGHIVKDLSVYPSPPLKSLLPLSFCTVIVCLPVHIINQSYGIVSSVHVVFQMYASLELFMHPCTVFCSGSLVMHFHL